MAIVRKSIVGISIMALVLSLSTASVITLSATPAFAERGGNGNGGANRNSRSNRDKGRSENARGNSAANSNGRGAVARELRGLNAAHANQTALENASPNSMPGKLYIYQQSQQEYAALAKAEADALAEYDRLVNLTEEEIATEFPDGGYEDAVTEAAIEYETAQADASDAETDIDASLATLTGGEDLSDAALAELNRLLGL